MVLVADAGAFLLGTDLLVEIARHLLELGDHQLDLLDAAAFLLDLETLQPNETLTRLHRTHYSPRSGAAGTPLRDTHTRRPPGGTALPTRDKPLVETLNLSLRANVSFTSRVNHGEGRLKAR